MGVPPLLPSECRRLAAVQLAVPPAARRSARPEAPLCSAVPRWRRWPAPVFKQAQLVPCVHPSEHIVKSTHCVQHQRTYRAVPFTFAGELPEIPSLADQSHPALGRACCLSPAGSRAQHRSRLGRRPRSPCSAGPAAWAGPLSTACTTLICLQEPTTHWHGMCLPVQVPVRWA